MSVPKGKRKPSQFEVFHHLTFLRKDVTDLLLRDFGYSPEKAKEKLSRRFGGKDYEDLSDVDKTLYDRILQKHGSFENWFQSWFMSQCRNMSKLQKSNMTELYDNLREAHYPCGK